MSPARVLIVDDDPAIHDVLEAYLGLSGYVLMHAEEGRQGLEMMLGGKLPDLLIIDVQMPVMDGFGLLERIKANPLLAEIPVIMLSSLDRPNIKVKALQMGAEDYIVKPFDQAELMARVAVALRRSEAQRKMEQTFSGILGPVSIIELLQTMAHGDKTARLQLPEMDAEVLLSCRRVLSARWGSFEGVEALRRMLFSEHGRFKIHFENHECDHSIGSIEDLLLSNLVYIDELREEFAELFEEPRSLLPEETLPIITFSGNQELKWPVEVTDLLLAMEGDMKKNAQQIRDLISSGLLVYEGTE